MLLALAALAVIAASAASSFNPKLTPSPSVASINTSLYTIPTGYFGGNGVAPRPQDEIELLAEQRMIVIEKWEGPCWAECLSNSSSHPPIPCNPACGA